MEYLKNVVLKFMLSGGEEQEQLVPALATLLQFSTDETQRVRSHIQGIAGLLPAKVRSLLYMREIEEKGRQRKKANK